MESTYGSHKRGSHNINKNKKKVAARRKKKEEKKKRWAPLLKVVLVLLSKELAIPEKEVP